MMDEEARMTEYNSRDGREVYCVSEWELGLPYSDDLTPLSHQLISPELASAFRIPLEPYRIIADVDRASRAAISSISGQLDKTDGLDRMHDDDGDGDDDVAKAMKRPRLVWNPQLHKRFVDVVGHLGLKNAVPKTIMQMMNVEGLTRENVASHLQKYRLYLKRMSHDDGPSESESGGHAAMPVMMHVPMVPGHMGYPWMQQHREAESNDK